MLPARPDPIPRAGGTRRSRPPSRRRSTRCRTCATTRSSSTRARTSSSLVRAPATPARRPERRLLGLPRPGPGPHPGRRRGGARPRAPRAPREPPQPGSIAGSPAASTTAARRSPRSGSRGGGTRVIPAEPGAGPSRRSASAPPAHRGRAGPALADRRASGAPRPPRGLAALAASGTQSSAMRPSATTAAQGPRARGRPRSPTRSSSSRSAAFKGSEREVVVLVDLPTGLAPRRAPSFIAFTRPRRTHGHRPAGAGTSSWGTAGRGSGLTPTPLRVGFRRKET